MHRRVLEAFLAICLLFVAACGPDRATPTGPGPQSGPSREVQYYYGWNGYLDPLESHTSVSSDAYLTTCPAQISLMGPVGWDGRIWYTNNGPYRAVINRPTVSRYVTVTGLVTEWSSPDGALAVSDSWQVTCESFLGLPTFRLESFLPQNWQIRYTPSSGGDDNQCIYQDMYDPSQPCGPGGTGGSGGGSGGSGGSGSGGTGGVSGGGCTQEYIYIEVSYDNGGTWSTWWEGMATVC